MVLCGRRMVVRPFGKTQGHEQVEGQAHYPVFDPEASS